VRRVYQRRGGGAFCSLPFLVEAGYSARLGADRTATMADLARLPRVRIDREIEEIAMHTQRELAEIGRHRSPRSDLIIAACAHAAQMRVLHYDGADDLLAGRASPEFASSRLAPPGDL
jgi:predicted nucleic acid-binding protein